MTDYTNEHFTFGIIDGEYVLQMNKTLLVSELKKPIQTYLNVLGDTENAYDECTDKQKKEKLEKDILTLYEKIDLKNLKTLDYSILFGCFLSSIMKIVRENNVSYPIIVFDKSPYFHKTAIEGYKSDRYNSSDWSDELTERLKSPDLTVNERLVMEYQKQLADYDTANFWEYQKVKRSFIELEKDKWDNAGFHCIAKRGYEADQLSYFLARFISEKHKINPKINCVLLSSDKDWTNFVMPGVIFQSIWNGNLKDRRYGNLTEEWNDFHEDYLEFAKNQTITKDWKDITRYEYGILKELFITSHNAATLYDELEDDYREYLMEKYAKNHNIKLNRNTKKEAMYFANIELFFRIINKCKNKKFKAYSQMKHAYRAMNVNLGKTIDNGYCDNIGIKYVDDLHDTCINALKICNTYKKGSLITLIDEHNISINTMNYNKYIKNLVCL